MLLESFLKVSPTAAELTAQLPLHTFGREVLFSKLHAWNAFTLHLKTCNLCGRSGIAS
jgi:hypothetical protein